MEKKHRPGCLILAAVGLTAALALPSAAQNGVADLDPADCSNGTFVADPTADPGLAADCRALVAVRNHWTRRPDNVGLPSDHPLLNWGRGVTVDITSWSGIRVESQRVTAIFLHRVGINGTIPPELARLTNLKRLDLGFNGLTGQIPSQLFQLTNLENFDVFANGITGQIPAEFTRLTNLSWLNLANNRFTGQIPAQLSQLTKLELLNLYNNELIGPIPTELSRLTNLVYLNLGKNEHTGQIPPELSRLTKLEELILKESNLTGSIPPRLSQLTNLKKLELQNNRFTGPIPFQFSQLTNLTRLDLSSNELSGSIPPGLSQLTKLRYLFLNNNQFTGPIPPQFSHLTNLRVLNLSYNRLSGPIPIDLSQLKNLRYLTLIFNQFTGPIPPQITELDDLEIIDPFDSDLGLVANVEELRKISLGNNLWEVWLCDTGGPVDLDLDNTTDLLNRTVSPYFTWLSGGRFTPQFVATANITFTRRELADLRREDYRNPLFLCEDKMISSEEHNETKKGIIIENTAHAGGVARSHALVGGGTVKQLSDDDNTPRLKAIAHELGHLLGWPHSYNGVVSYDGVFDEYDNSTDIMSRGNNVDLSTGTPAINRYAAGWIDPEDVVIYSGEPATHQLSPIGLEGTQMLIVPSEQGQGIFYSLSPLTAKDYNRDQPKEGVEVYLIDQSPSVCDLILYTDEPCRRTQPYPPQRVEVGRGSAHHVRGVGDSFQLGDVWVEIQERRGDRFTVAVGSGCGGYFEGRFCDDEGNVHSDSIEAVADWAITRGCGANRFCPHAVITRSQMAAFLYRAVTHISEGPSFDAEAAFDDVAVGAWYRLYAQWAVDAGVMQSPDGMFDPDGVVTRVDMAEMMTAAFGLTLPASPRGVFADMEGQPDRAVRAAEALRTAGVTAGCSASPLRFCPGRPITRAQMASFFYRALS